MLTGCTIRPFHIGPRIGQGAFGEIYVVRSFLDNSFFALKIEPLEVNRKILEFEANIMKRLHPSPYFPLFNSYGRTSKNTWLSMELLGPSLSFVVKQLPSFHFSVSTGLRVVDFILIGLEKLHEKGVIHRDIKPSNILLRRSNEFPIAIIDFGLSRIYTDKKTNRIFPPRQNPGFRGTAVFASPNAHMHQDLGRRDDLISWFYLALDLLLGPLPWRKLDNRADIFHMKRKTNISNLAENISPHFVEIWNLISNLSFEEKPNYDLIHDLIQKSKEFHKVDDKDLWDWEPAILRMDSLEDEIMVNRLEKVSSEISIPSIHEEEILPADPSIKRPMLDSTPLIGPPPTKAEAYNDEHCCCKLI